jgi:hypothetical protein
MSPSRIHQPYSSYLSDSGAKKTSRRHTNYKAELLLPNSAPLHLCTYLTQYQQVAQQRNHRNCSVFSNTKFLSSSMFSRTGRLSSVAAASRVSQISSHVQRQRRNMATHKLNTGATIPAVGFGTWQDKV